MENSTVVFVHIPKTAGTSFINFLLPNYNKNAFIEVLDIGLPPIVWTSMIESKKLPEIQDMIYVHQISKDKLNACKLMRGHFYGSVFDTLFDVPPRYVTMLRNPIDQFISFYNHFIKRMPDIFTHKKAKDMTFLEFLRDEEVMFWYKDLQTQYIAKEVSMDEAYSKNLDFDFETHRQAQERYVKIPDDVLFEKATKQLDRYLFVGIVEKYQESVSLLAHLLNLKQGLGQPPLNVSNIKYVTKEILVEEEIEAIKNITRVDHLIYEYAKEELEKRYDAMVENQVFSADGEK